MLYTPEKCLRGRTDCLPLSQIESDMEPKTFVCCGENDGSSRSEPQDQYRLCIKGCGGQSGYDTMQDCDRRDLSHQLSVIAWALGIISEDHD